MGEKLTKKECLQRLLDGVFDFENDEIFRHFNNRNEKEQILIEYEGWKREGGDKASAIRHIQNLNYSKGTLIDFCVDYEEVQDLIKFLL